MMLGCEPRALSSVTSLLTLSQFSCDRKIFFAATIWPVASFLAMKTTLRVSQESNHRAKGKGGKGKRQSNPVEAVGV